jgi:ABC-type lipoprotein release transport system permease subunit
VASASAAELVFVVDVSALTSKGFVGTTKYEGKRVELDFDDGDAGVFLNSEMAGRLHVKKGSRLSVVIEGDSNQVADTRVASVGKTLRISDAKVYYAVGKEGGAILRVRKA